MNQVMRGRLTSASSKSVAVGSKCSTLARSRAARRFRPTIGRTPGKSWGAHTTGVELRHDRIARRAHPCDYQLRLTEERTMKVIPVQPRAERRPSLADETSTSSPTSQGDASRRTFGKNLPSRRTFGIRNPSRCTF